MNYITALVLLGIFSQRSLALSLEESNTGPVSDQQIIMQLQLQVMKTENDLSLQKTWTEHLVNRQDRMLSQLGRLYTVVHQLVEHLTMASSDSAEVIDSVRKNLLEQQERSDSVTGRLSDRLGGLEEEIREQKERAALAESTATERLEKLEDKAPQMLDRLNQLDIQIGVEQEKVGNNTSKVEKLRDSVEVLEKQISGQEEKASSGEILVAKRLDNIEKVLSGQQENIALNISRFAADLSGLKEQLPGHQLKVMERIGSLEKDFANKQQKIEAEGSKLSEVLNGTLRDSQTTLTQLQDQLTNQQKTMSKHEAVIKESESKLKKLWKNRAVSFQKLDSKYYYFEINEKLYWQDARDRCEEFGSHLVSLQTKQEYNLVIENIVGDETVQYWTDVNDINSEGVFISSTTGKEANFLKWRRTPDNWNGIEDCVELARSGMNDLQCSEELFFICEK